MKQRESGPLLEELSMDPSDMQTVDDCVAFCVKKVSSFITSPCMQYTLLLKYSRNERKVCQYIKTIDTAGINKHRYIEISDSPNPGP